MEINEQQISDLISENERLKELNQRKRFISASVMHFLQLLALSLASAG